MTLWEEWTKIEPKVIELEENEKEQDFTLEELSKGE